MRKAVPLKFFHVHDDYAPTPDAKQREATPLVTENRPKRLILDAMNVSSFYAVNPELLKFPPISFEPVFTQEGQEQEKPRNWSLDLKWLNITGDVTSPFPKNRVLMKHELQQCYNVTFDEENIKETMTSRAVLDEHTKINENQKKMKTILDLSGSKTKVENKKKKIKEISFNPEDHVTAIFLHLSQQKKRIKKKLQTLPQFQHQRRKSCQSSWSGGLSKLEKKLETRIWNNDPHLPRQPHHFQPKNFSISAIAKSKINTKKKLINKLKTRNQLIRKHSRTVISNRATPAVEIHNGPASSAKLSSETELDKTLSITSRLNHQTPENGQKSHFRRYSQFQPNTKRSQEENVGTGGGEPQSIKFGTDGSPLTGDKVGGGQEDSPFLRRPSKTATETLAVVGSKEDFSPKVISVFGQNMQTPRQSGMIYSFQEGLDEKIEEDNTDNISQKPGEKPVIILKKDDSNKNSKPQSPAFNQDDVIKELTNLKKDMKKVKGYLQHVKKRSFKKSKMTKSKLIQQQAPDVVAQVVQTEPAAEIVLTEPQEGPKTARSRKELTRIVATPKAASSSVTKVKNIYNNSLNFGLDFKWVDTKSYLPLKETSRSPLTSLRTEPKSTQLTTTKIGSPYLMPSNPTINSQSFLSIQKNEKGNVVNTKTLQDVVVAQKGLTERTKEEKKSKSELPQITKPRPKIQIKAWDEGVMDKKSIPSGIQSCSSRTISSMLANSKIIL